MIFENRRISEITDQELKDLIGNQEENLWIDFKQQDYHRDPEDLEKHKREIRKDVTAMANAEGGYILIGVREEDKIAQDFFTVPDAERVAQRIRDTCHQFIDRRILNLEVDTRTFQWEQKEVTLVIIHIPSGELRPHGFEWGGSTNFVKRYADVTKEYPMSELGDAFSVRHYPPIIGSIDRKLDAILANTQEDRRHLISPGDNPLEQMEVINLLHLMRMRFDEAISNQPYYRIIAVPTQLDPDAVNTRDENIRNTMCNPPDRRYGNFGVTGILDREMLRSPEGISGPNVTNGEIILLENGFLEVRCPLSNGQFQWRHEESQISRPWLYPYVVCEFPVTFLRLVKRIYEASDIASSLLIQQEYHNLEGFTLIGGDPSNSFFSFVFEDEMNVYTQSTPIVSKQTVEPDFNPEHIAYDLVKEVYDYFRLGAEWIPAFDENGNFILQ